jgi:hypothetical protein
MMAIGFAGLGYAAYGRRRKFRAQASIVSPLLPCPFGRPPSWAAFFVSEHERPRTAAARLPAPRACLNLCSRPLVEVASQAMREKRQTRPPPLTG